MAYLRIYIDISKMIAVICSVGSASAGTAVDCLILLPDPGWFIYVIYTASVPAAHVMITYLERRLVRKVILSFRELRTQPFVSRCMHINILSAERQTDTAPASLGAWIHCTRRNVTQRDVAINGVIHTRRNVVRRDVTGNGVSAAHSGVTLEFGRYIIIDTSCAHSAI